MATGDRQSPVEHAVATVLVGDPLGPGVTSPPDAWGSRLLDLKGVARPPAYDGKAAGWQEWKFRICSVCDLLGLGVLMEQAQIYPTVISYGAMDDALQQRARFLYSMFVQILSGRALGVLRLVQQHNGFEAWRQLVLEYEPDSPIRVAAMLRALMSPHFTDSNFRVEWMQWEQKVSEYDKTAIRPMDDAMKVAAVIDGCPSTVRAFLRLVPVHIVTYRDLRDAIRSFLDRGLTFDAEGNEQSAMEVGLVATTPWQQPPGINAFTPMPRPWDKGKGKGKTDGKGKSAASAVIPLSLIHI